MMNNPGESQDEQTTRRKLNTAEFFNRVAPHYDRTGPRFFSYFGQRLVEAALIVPGEHVLDIATGRGAVLFPAAQAAEAGGVLVGVDFSQQMVTEISQEVQHLGAQNISIRQMDAENLQFPDAAFDVVLCGFALFFFPQLERALAEMRRVLKPGGRIAVSTWDQSMDSHWEWFYQAAITYLAADPAAKPIPIRPPGSDLDFPAGLEKTLQAAGFVNVQVLLKEHDFVYPSNDEWWSALWTHWTRMALERIEQATGSEGLRRFQKIIYNQLDQTRQPDGIHQIFPALIAAGSKP